MRHLKFAFLIGFIAFATIVKSQTVQLTVNESIIYNGQYEATLYVYDNVTNTTTQVGYKKNQYLQFSFESWEINLSGVNLINDQVKRYRYIVIVRRQDAPGGTGSGSTPLLDSGQVLSGYPVTVNMPVP